MHIRILFYILLLIGTIGTHTALQANTIPPVNDQFNKEVVTSEPVKSTEVAETIADEDSVRVVPFYSQFANISSAKWKKVSCGIASLAMLIDYYEDAVAPDTLLQEGIASGAYDDNAGWSHAGLINLAKKRGLAGASISLSGMTTDQAFAELESVLEEGPVMASVHYTFEPTNPIPHLVVITDVKDGMVYYNDPAEKNGSGSISIKKFKSSWKKRYIEIRPQA